MASMKRGASVASMLILAAIIISACNQPYSTPPSVTSTPINPNSLFGSPIAQATSMTDVANLATASAIALSGTPVVGIATATPGANTTQVVGASLTPTPIIQLPTNAVTTPTATMALSTSQPAATSVPGVRPATYTLQAGEFVYCIARRFNVDPDQLLALNGLSDGQTVYPGLVLKIPQTGTFPGDRMLQRHPTTYTVVSSSETLYSIACKYGDVEPSAIATANGISVGAALTAGQQLSIP